MIRMIRDDVMDGIFAVDALFFVFRQSAVNVWRKC